MSFSRRLIFVVLMLGFSLGFSSAWAGPEFADSPAGCFSKNIYPCSLRVTGSFLSFEREFQKYHLGDGSAVLFLSADEIQLLQGVLWIRESKDLTVKVSPPLRMRISGEHIFQKKGLDLHVFNVDGLVQFKSAFVFQSEALPKGFQNWYGQVDSSGQVSRGMIRPISMGDFLRAWMPVSGASLAEAKKMILHCKENWKDAVEISAGIYQEVAERRIASDQAKIRLSQEAKRRKLTEQAQLRQMYRSKNGLEGL